MKFLIMYHSTISAAEQMAAATPEQAKAGMDQWMRWAGEAGTAIADMGSPVGPAETFAGGGRTTLPSSVAGYSILEAESWDALAKLLAGHPHFHAPGATIVAHEFLALPGM